LRQPTAYAFLTEEEQELVARRARVRRPAAVIGLGVDLAAAGDGAAFRARHDLGDDPYLLYVGRLDPGKGSDELFGHFRAFAERHHGGRHGQLRLVVVGEPVAPLPAHPRVVTTGFVAESVKLDAVAGCTALVMPSYYESFSLVLAEAWAQSKPALVNDHCAVLRGQARRSGGAIPYRGFAEFEAAVELLLDHPDLQGDLGWRGRRYVETRYPWEAVLDRTEALLDLAVRYHRRAVPPVALAPVVPAGGTPGQR